MILKELDPFHSNDPYLKAGRAAEEQMAFYLRRAFDTNPDLLVFNNLRLEHEGDAAQIDHLVLHRFGVVIIESKSVSGSVEVNQHGEWVRHYGNTRRGMPSPIEQARRQGEFLRKHLQRESVKLLGKILWLQKGFRNMNVDVLVAISDTGIIKRTGGAKVEEVVKADQVPARAKQIHQEWAYANSFIGMTRSKGPREAGWGVEKDEVSRIADYLMESHRPVTSSSPGRPPAQPSSPAIAAHHAAPHPTPHAAAVTASTPAAPAAMPRPAPAACRVAPAAARHPVPDPAGSELICRHCKSARMSVEFARYGYFGKCLECEKNTPIQFICPACGGKERTRKSGKEFYRECGVCTTSRRYHTNAV